jgi:hypothetical protein
MEVDFKKGKNKVKSQNNYKNKSRYTTQNKKSFLFV